MPEETLVSLNRKTVLLISTRWRNRQWFVVLIQCNQRAGRVERNAEWISSRESGVSKCLSDCFAGAPPDILRGLLSKTWCRVPCPYRSSSVSVQDAVKVEHSCPGASGPNIQSHYAFFHAESRSNSGRMMLEPFRISIRG